MLTAHDWLMLCELILGTIGATAGLFWFIVKLLIDGLPKKLDTIYLRKDVYEASHRRSGLHLVQSGPERAS